MTPQEKLLEYSLFDLSNNDGPSTMTPTTADFGDQVVGYASTSKPFTMNDSVFAAALTSFNTVGDFMVTDSSS